MIKKDPFNLAETDKLYGIFRGVVEDNNDPDKLGRCKIRVFGIHTANKTNEEIDGIPTDHLPWSEPALSLFEGGMTGFGNFAVPLQGSHVFIFFEQGHILKPIYFASIPGYPTDQYHGFKGPKGNEGFSDPDENYPNKTTEFPHKPNELNESDYHRLARNEGISETIVQSKTNNLDTGVETANGNTWNEPNPYYAAEYPNNKVLSTHSGITIEIDDTNGEERIHIYHPSNSYIEIEKEGNIIVRNNKNKYEIVMESKNQHILEDENKTVDNDRTKQVGNNEYDWVGNNEIVEIVNNSDKTVGGNYTLTINGNCNISVTGAAHVFSSTAIACDAPTIDLNSGIANFTSATQPK